MSFEDPRSVLRRHGLVPKRSFSQNFLVSERAVRAIVSACKLSAGEHVVEIGAGCGTLTLALADAGAFVHAIERDADMQTVLRAECAERSVEVIAADAKELELRAWLPEGHTRVTVAGNLPYAITGLIFRALTDQHERVKRAVLMVQREVRDRLVAAPDAAEYGALTVFTTRVFQIDTVIHLPRTAFHPPPKVTSSVVALTPLPFARAHGGASFDTVVRAAFGQRRKTLRNALGSLLTAATAELVLGDAGIDPKRRGETLSVEEFGAIADALSRLQTSQRA